MRRSGGWIWSTQGRKVRPHSRVKFLHMPFGISHVITTHSTILGDRVMFGYFLSLSSFERSRWRLLGFLLLQLGVTFLIANDWNEGGAVAAAGAAGLVAVLTKRREFADRALGRRSIYGIFIAVIVVSLFSGVCKLVLEIGESNVTGGFWLWLAPIAAGILGILDWNSSLKAPSATPVVVVQHASATCAQGHPIH